MNHPRFSISILMPSIKFSGPCSIKTTQQKVAITKKVSQRKMRKQSTFYFKSVPVSVPVSVRAEDFLRPEVPSH